MPEITCYHLEPRAALHVGAQGIEQEETLTSVPSDTLYAALLVAWRWLHGAAEPWERAFVGEEPPPFLLGSAFPRVGKLRFYPWPRLELRGRGLPEGLNPKALRRVRYVSEGLWQRLLGGQTLAGLWPADEASETASSAPSQGGAFLQGGALWLTCDELSLLPASLRELENGRSRPLRALPLLRVWETYRVPRVAVDRLQRGSDIYFTGRLVFNEGCGLWFPVAWLRPDQSVPEDGRPWRAAFETALAALGDAGLGGERSTGLGAFAWRRDDDQHWAQPRPGAPCVMLSRYHPRSSEELRAALRGEHVRYQLASVAGYLQSPDAPAQRRRRLWLLAEGSVLSAAGAVMGDVTDVRPQVGNFPHPVWRYGLALAAPLEVPHA